jgi:hypothetical protein
MIRKSEYLPETQKPLSAELKGGGDTWIYQGIPGSFYDPGFFFARWSGSTAEPMVPSMVLSLALS